MYAGVSMDNNGQCDEKGLEVHLAASGKDHTETDQAFFGAGRYLDF
jgi:hypothetical protein